MMSSPALTRLSGDQAQHVQWVGSPALRGIIRALEAPVHGSAMFVGGCVRDSLLGDPPVPGNPDNPADIDIATTLKPDETIAALKQAGLKAVPTGYDHGTITAVAGGTVAEVTSLRADVDTDGRHAVVAYTNDWNEDWRRRDFTINAMYMTSDLKLFDPAGGLADLQVGKVVFIGDAETRIREDYLRILRFYRFSARFAERFNATGNAACRKLAEGLEQISAERITTELTKILSGPRIPFALEGMQEAGILRQVCSEPANISVAEHLFELNESHGHASPELFLAALWEDAQTLISRLRLSNQQTGRIRAAQSSAAWVGGQPDMARVKELTYRQGQSASLDAILLQWARSAGADQSSDWESALRLVQYWKPPVNPFTASVFLARGLKAGPELGRVLNEAEKHWIEAGYPGDDESIARILGRVLTST